ncbi:hypothetical protein ASE70_14865 [Sphingomonas sp. Leaf22]|uniref:hypothetical protein n=1 Tax=Sphingomonas sp. Leaf22 TaxID=1735687 RepID=UPI0007009EB3|nr:hypothetical protein [Sphingomonas sp. Leaf22]KQM92194.1 hypothetical protein ASE70_14865 [Sphingomonas sp. Leaf22]
MTPTERLALVRNMSVEGVTKVDAAARLGMTVRGFDTMLYRHEGSTIWPIGRAPVRRRGG